MRLLRHLQPPLWMLVTLGLVPGVLQIGGTSPPWPSGIGWVTAIGCVALGLSLGRLRLRHSEWFSRRVMVVSGILMLLAFTVFLVLMSRFTFLIPTTGEIGVKGFVCTPEALLVYPGNCPGDDREALGSAEFEAPRIWQQWTIDIMRLIMLMSWSAGFIGLCILGAGLVTPSFGALLASAPSPYEGDRLYYFMSYAHTDIPHILPILECLMELNIHIWYDKGIPGATAWDETISYRLQNSAGVIAFLSSASLGSKWVRREIMFADDLNKRVFCVRLEQCTLPPPLDMVLTRNQIIEGDPEYVASEFQRAMSPN